MSLIIAFSTTDAKMLANSHFGDAHLYPVYEISKEKIKLLEIVENLTQKNKEKIHGDPKKAKGISQILKPRHVQVLCAKQFGKNIERMRKNFVPVFVRVDTVDEALLIVQQNLDKIEIQWNKNEDRKHLKI